MTIFLDEKCVASLVTMDDALEAVEEVFREQSNGNVLNVPRVRAPIKDGVLRITAGVIAYRGYYGIKVTSSAVFGKSAGRLFYLYREESGELCAIMQVFALSTMRTGAASGIATKYLANPEAELLGVLGAGRQAKTQVEAVAKVRALREIRVFSPTTEHRRQFCDDIERSFEIKAIAVDTPAQAVVESDIIIAATTSRNPVVRGEWLAPGTHINAIGANFESRRELDSAAVAAANFIVTDDLEQARYESTDLIEPVKEGVLAWDRVHGISDVVGGRLRGRASPSDITLFKSLGIAPEDVAFGARVYERALERKAGVMLPDLAG